MMKSTLIGGIALAALGLAACAGTENAAAPAPATAAAETHIDADKAARVASFAIETAEVARGAGAADYVISWTLSDPAAPVTIEVSDTPNAAPGEGTVIAAAATGGQLTWTAPDMSERRYFVISAPHAEPVTTALRLLPLEGGRNFRDLGGYATADGRHVKWGTFFRSGVMTGLTAADYDYLGDLGVAVICDLRTSQERTSEPTHWQAGDVSYLTFADPQENSDSNALATIFQSPDVTPEKVAAMMTDLYAGILEQQTPAYRVMFDELANGHVPLAFNCSAGKDRTGIGAALLLSTLGVPRDVVVADYALSEKVVDYAKEFQLGADAATEDDGPYAYLRKLPPELVAPLMRSDPAYVTAVLDSIDAEYGDVVAFVQTELGIDDAELASIRTRLLTP